MDHKRKANGSNGTGVGNGDDRAAKRQKGASDGDLSKGETPESTSVKGLAFLEQIRKTADKHGRPVAGYFEKLLPRDGNEDYYQKIRLPISLETIERKLNNHEFATMSELESYMKRMVTNAKEYYTRNSDIYDDAERVRKATSNYMTKNNPAYKLIPNYSAIATPIPADGDQEEQNDVRPARSSARAKKEVEEVEEDAEGEDEDEDADGEEDEDADGEADDDADEPVAPRRRGPGRPPRGDITSTPKVADRSSIGGGKADTQYEDVAYNGLTFQQAQEKIVEELIRRKEEEDEWAYFEPFMNLPPRALKDYYQLIEEPISLKKLQKLVKGVHGRGDATGVSDFKSWAAFEEKASLLWENAFYYNEEGSEISEMAKELKDAFYEELQDAKEAVDEPPQPKIKLKSVSASASTSEPPKPKKITIHVGGRDSSVGSPAPATGRSGSAHSDAIPNGAAVRAPFTQATMSLGPLDQARSLSISGASPSPSAGVKREDANRQSPAVGMRPVNGVPLPPGVAPAGYNGQPHHPGLPNGHSQAAPSPGLPYDIKYRLPGRTAADALITNLCIRTQMSLNQDRRFVFNLPAHPKEAQQSVTINLPITQWKIQVIPRINQSLEAQGRPYKLFVIVNGQTMGRQIPSPQDPVDPGCQLFDVQLHAGVNTIMVQMIAAVPKGQKLPNGADAELEKITVLANLIKY